MTRTKKPYVPSPQRLADLARLGKPLTDNHKITTRQETIIDAFSTKQSRTNAYFWSRVAIKGENECWNWLRSTQGGYGRVVLNRQIMYSHRVAAILSGILSGPYDPHQIRFSCNNKLCCNPSHLTRHAPTESYEVIQIPQSRYDADQRRGLIRGTAGNPVVEPISDTPRRRGPGKQKGLPMGWRAPWFKG